jgi:protein-tyrosine phosphatase
MGLLSFFSNRKKEKEDYHIDLSQIKTDIHAHFLPGIDDGSPSMEESVRMIQAMKALGYEKVISTPHVMQGYYQNSTKIIREAHEQLKSVIAKERIQIELEVAAEYNFDNELLHRLKEDDILSFGNNKFRYLLFELSYYNEPMGLIDLVKKIKEKGYIPVLAHPERYPYFSANKDQYRDLQTQGVMFQLNLNSLNGLYSLGAKASAEWLIEQRMVQFIASDAHRASHVEMLDDALKYTCLHDLLKEVPLMNAEV